MATPSQQIEISTTVESTLASPRWPHQTAAWAVRIGNWTLRAWGATWWLIFRAEVVRQVAPGEPPEVIDQAERLKAERGPWPLV